MTIPKKRVPLAFLEILKPEKLKNIHPVEDDKAIMCLHDKEAGTGFYFRIISEDPNSHRFLTEINPPSKNSTTVLKVEEQVAPLIGRLNSWIELIDSYGKIETIYDDPIIKSYEAEFEEKFEIIDEDADVAPFNLEQQNYLDSYLEHVKKQMNLLKAGKNEDEQREFTEIENEAILLQKELTKENKKEIVKKLSRILAKARKIGLEVFKQVAIDILSEVGKRMLMGG